MTHGWVDDLEERVISIKYGPTEEEGDGRGSPPRDVPVTRITQRRQEPCQARAPAQMVGVQKGSDGGYTGVFVFVGKDGLVPAM